MIKSKYTMIMLRGFNRGYDSGDKYVINIGRYGRRVQEWFLQRGKEKAKELDDSTIHSTRESIKWSQKG